MELFAQIDPWFILYCLAGSAAGVLFGSLPGLSVTLGTALLVTATFSWPVQYAMAAMLGLYVSGVYAGAVTAILINIPGAPSSVATTFDGYPLAKNGRAAFALWTATFHSFAGGLLGFAALGFLAEPISRFALDFTQMDYFLLALLGLSTVGALSAGNWMKGWGAAAFGIFLSLVGPDPFTGGYRFTFGILEMQGGIGVIPVLIGLFGISEVLDQLTVGQSASIASTVGRLRMNVPEQIKYWKVSVQSSLIGAAVGILPGAGTPVASLLAYAGAQKTVRKPERPFGTGTPEGVVAAEAANNACVGGALIPMLTLAIPGDAVTAVMLAGFQVHGLRPGPLLFSDSPALFNLVLAGGLISCFIMLALGIILARPLSRIVLVPKKILLPLVSMLCVIGTYSVNASLFDVWIMLITGCAGFFMKRFGYPAAPAALGLVLGGLMDASLRRAVNLALAGDNFFEALFWRPVSLALLVLAAASFALNIPALKRKISCRHE